MVRSASTPAPSVVERSRRPRHIAFARICSTARTRRATWLLGDFSSSFRQSRAPPRSRRRRPSARARAPAGRGSPDRRCKRRPVEARRRSGRPSRRPRCARRDRCRRAARAASSPFCTATADGDRRPERAARQAAGKALRRFCARESRHHHVRSLIAPAIQRCEPRRAMALAPLPASRQCARAMQKATACSSAALNGSSGNGASASRAMAP